MTTNELLTLGIAGYAAIISTFVLGWDAYKWLASGPKVRLTVSTGMKLVGNGAIDPKTYVSAIAVNLGDRPTTITNLGFLYYRSRFSLWRNKADQSFVILTPSDAQLLPYRFEVGAQWMGKCEQTDDLKQMMRDGYLFIALYHSHGGDGVKKRLRLSESKT